MFVAEISSVRSAEQHRRILVLGAVAVLTLITLVPATFTQSNRMITTVAGTGVCGFSGDGGLATRAQVNGAAGVAVDFAGNLYIADLGNHVIRKVTSFGTITTVAGTGAAGYNGDNKLATNAQLAAPAGVAVDTAGRKLYIADEGNHAIRKVDLQTLTITTVAGTPEQSGFSGDKGLATQAKLNYPVGVAIDALGNLYIADSTNRRVRKVDPDGIITTVAGNGQRGSNGAGDNGLATQASFKGLAAIALGPDNDLFIADSEDHRVRRVDANGIITTFAGNSTFGPPTPGLATKSSVRLPQGLATDVDGSLYIADNVSHMILQVSVGGMLTIVAGTGTASFGGDNGPAAQALLNGPSGLAVDHFRNLFISDTLNCRVRRVSAP
jgi:DNA-binding beta-propeller fold protein YncE